MKKPTLVLVVLALALAGLAVAGCGDDDDSDTTTTTSTTSGATGTTGATGADSGSIPTSEIESKATESLTKQVGQEPKSIDGPKDLPLEEGASETCVLTADDGTTIDMTATVKSVSGDSFELDFQVADKPNN